MAWDDFRTDDERGIVAGITRIPGGNGDSIHAYVARPDGAGPYPGVVLVHHLPGWDEFYQEFARRFANHGFIAVAPDLYCRDGHGTPEDVAAKVRAEGGVADARVIADCEAAMQHLKAMPMSNGKVGITGTCSGGRHAVLVASSVQGFNAVADLWGGGVVMSPEQLTEKQPVAPIDLTPNLNMPILGLFGNEDPRPSRAEVDLHEQVLRENGKDPVFVRYDGAGHGFFYYHRPSYNQLAAMDGWGKLAAFFKQHLG